MFGLNVIIYGTVIVHVNNDPNDKNLYILHCLPCNKYHHFNFEFIHLASVVKGCDINSIMGNTMYAVMFDSFQALTSILTFLFYFPTIWKMYKLRRKDCNLEHMDDNRRRKVRMRKRMVESMKVGCLILTTFLISTVPAVVLG